MKDLFPKKEIIKFVNERRKNLSPVEVKRKSIKIANNLLEIDEVLSAKNFLLYNSKIVGDVDTTFVIDLLLGMGKNISLPKFNKSQNNYFRGVFLGWDKTIVTEDTFVESTVSVDDNFDDIDLIIVPSLAVSEFGKRIGYGNEFYTNLLSKTLAPKITLAFEFQIFKNIEILGDELEVSKVVTERRVIHN